MEKKPLIIIAGSTATGKTKYSIELAKRHRGSVISADSMQVYRGMDIGSAKITADEMQGIPHYLVDILEPTEDFNVAVFCEKAKAAIDDIYEEGRLPLVVGGTGFYIRALLYGADFSYGEEDREYRKKLTDFAEKHGAILITGGGLAITPYADYLPLSMDKAALRAMVQALTPVLNKKNIYIGTVQVTGVIGSNEKFLPKNIAEEFWKLYDKRHTNEIIY